jgi:phage gp36-like protein
VLYPFVSAADLAELFDDDEDGSVDTTVYDAFVTMIEAQYESRICRRYDIPLDTSDATILAVSQFYCARLAEYHVFARRRAVTEEIGSRYQQTLRELDDINNGKSGLTDVTPVEAEATTAYSSAESTDRSFSPSGMAAWGGGSARD